MRVPAIALAIGLASFAAAPAAAEDVIRTLGAVYGTPSAQRTCDATAAVAAACDGKRSCDVAASNGLCGDPDYGTRKTLEVEYQCGPALARSASAPELSEAHLGCD